MSTFESKSGSLSEPVRPELDLMMENWEIIIPALLKIADPGPYRNYSEPGTKPPTAYECRLHLRKSSVDKQLCSRDVTAVVGR
jgi:hypothetical protein